MNEGLKIGFLGALLLGVFALPTLTATQLVSVLGEKAAAEAVKINQTSGKDLVVTESSGSYAISYFSEGEHNLFLVENSSPIDQVVKITPESSPDGALLSQSVSLVSASTRYPLFEHSVQPAHSSYEV